MISFYKKVEVVLLLFRRKEKQLMLKTEELSQIAGLQYSLNPPQSYD